jgi:glucan 1,3-beta-glucosidase
MAPSLFKDSDAGDEHEFCRLATPQQLARLKRHRDSFITEADFKWLAGHGIQAVRIPIGYWVFGGEAPYRSTLGYLDDAFNWAQAAGLKIVVSLHGAPGSQNGKAHSGQLGQVGWPQNPANIEKTLQVLERLAERYGSNSALLGIEILNEPHKSIPIRQLRDFYEAAYQRIRNHSAGCWVIFGDSFRPAKWRRTLRWPRYYGSFIDTHQYQVYGRRDKARTMAEHVRFTLHDIKNLLAKMQKSHPVIVGEWSCAVGSASGSGRQLYGAAQMFAYGQTAAWFYWTYKTEIGGPWDYRDCVKRGILPQTFDANF